MTVRRSSRIRTATVLLGITTAALAGAGVASAVSTADGDDRPAAGRGDDEPGRGDSLPDVSADASGWPAELTEHTRLFVNPYRSYLVQMDDGEPTLVLSTGFDSCVFMTQRGTVRYPC